MSGTNDPREEQRPTQPPQPLRLEPPTWRATRSVPYMTQAQVEAERAERAERNRLYEAARAREHDDEEQARARVIAQQPWYQRGWSAVDWDAAMITPERKMAEQEQVEAAEAARVFATPEARQARWNAYRATREGQAHYAHVATPPDWFE